MKELYYSISNDIFVHFPDYVRGIVFAYDVVNGESSDKLVSLLREAEASVRDQLTIENIAEHPRIKTWRDAYRSFGAKPSEFRSSIEGMARRVLRGEPLPSINALVDIGNLISLRRLVPVGGHAIDVITQDIELRPANGSEDFVAFGSTTIEHPLRGEIVFVEGNVVLTRRWTWRQSNHTLTLPETREIEFNIDGLPPVPVSEIEDICKEVIDLIKQFCGGRTRFEILGRENPRVKLAE